MRLPRKTIAQTNIVGELQSVRQGAITPAEAAREAMSKTALFMTGAKAIGDVALAIDEIKGQQESTDAMVDITSSFAKLDNDIKNLPPSVDETGKQSFDAQTAIKEATARQKEIISEARGGIKSIAGRKIFDRNTRSMIIRREGYVQAKLYERETELIALMAQDRLETMVSEDQFDGAIAYNDELVAIGTIGSEQHGKNEIAIKKNYNAFMKTGDEDYVYTELNDLQTTPDDLTSVLTSLGNGTRGDGTPLSVSEKDKNILMGKVRTKLATFEEDKDGAKKQVERDVFFDLYRKGLDGKLNLDMYEKAANQVGGFNSGYDKILRDMATGVVTDNFSSKDDLMYFRDSVRSLKFRVLGDDENWKETADNLLLDIQLSDLSYKHKQDLSKVVTDDISGLDDDRYKLMARQVYVDLVGFEEGMIGALNIDGAYNDKISMGVKARIALLDEVERTGTSEGLEEWWNGTAGQPGQKQIFRAEMNAETIQKVMASPVIFPVDGKIDEEWRSEVEASMLDWYNEPSMATQASERETDIDNAITNFENLTGIRLTDPIVQPIEVKK